MAYLKYIKHVGLVMILAFLLLFLPKLACQPDVDRPTNMTLRPDETAKTVVDHDKVGILTRVVSKDGTSTVKAKIEYLPPEGRVETALVNGALVTRIKNVGFSLAPGIGGAYTDGEVKIVIDVKLLYWKRLGLVAGTTFADLYVGPSWQIYHNTALFVGYGVKARPLIGLRVGF